MTSPNLSTKITYLVQTLDQHSDRWFNQGFPHLELSVGNERLQDLRSTYPERTFRLLQITATTIIIA